MARFGVVTGEAETKEALVAVVATVRANEKEPVEHKLNGALAAAATRRVARAARAYLRVKDRIQKLHDLPCGLEGPD